MTEPTKRIETLEKLIDLGACQGAEVLNTLLNSTVRVEVPSLKLFGDTIGNKENIPTDIGDILAAVHMGFEGSLKGKSGLIFEKSSALKLVERISGDEVEDNEFDLVSSGVLTEIGNIVLNAVMGCISNELKFSLDYVVPTFFQGHVDELIQLGESDALHSGLFAKTRFVLEELQTDGNIVLFLERASYEILMSAIAAKPE